MTVVTPYLLSLEARCEEPSRRLPRLYLARNNRRTPFFKPNKFCIRLRALVGDRASAKAYAREALHFFPFLQFCGWFEFPRSSILSLLFSSMFCRAFHADFNHSSPESLLRTSKTFPQLASSFWPGLLFFLLPSPQ